MAYRPMSALMVSRVLVDEMGVVNPKYSPEKLQEYVYKFFGGAHGGTQHMDRALICDEHGELLFWFHDAYTHEEDSNAPVDGVLIVFADYGRDLSRDAFEQLKKGYPKVPWDELARVDVWEK